MDFFLFPKTLSCIIHITVNYPKEKNFSNMYYNAKVFFSVSTNLKFFLLTKAKCFNFKILKVHVEFNYSTKMQLRTKIKSTHRLTVIYFSTYCLKNIVSLKGTFSTNIKKFTMPMIRIYEIFKN